MASLPDRVEASLAMTSSALKKPTMANGYLLLSDGPGWAPKSTKRRCAHPARS
jgi:hypothetical protein